MIICRFDGGGVMALPACRGDLRIDSGAGIPQVTNVVGRKPGASAGECAAVRRGTAEGASRPRNLSGKRTALA